MNYIIKEATLFLVFISFAYPQFNSKRDSSFFPHKVGNTWFYQWRNGITFNRTDKITADSVDEQGNTWLNINNNPDIKWSRKVSSSGDSVYLFPQDVNWLKYKKSLKKGEFWIVSEYPGRHLGYVKNTRYEYFAGRYRMFYDLAYKTTSPYADTFSVNMADYYETYAEGIGMMYYGEDAGYYILLGCIVDGDSLGYIPVNVENERKGSYIKNYSLSNNYPNPFNSSTKIEFILPKNEYIELLLYNTLGQKVKTLTSGFYNTGVNYYHLNAADLPSGIYLLSLQSALGIKNIKITIVK